MTTPHPLIRALMVPVGVLRLAFGALVLLVGGLAMVLLAPIPVRVRGVRLGAWPQTFMARTALWAARVHVRCPDRAALWQHRGLVFPNHVSFLDVVVLLAVVPVRFMATRGVARIPVIGWLATLLGTVYVNRGSERSRAQARVEAGEAVRRDPYPPLAVFPEGGIGPGDQVLPLRFGAFELAAEHDLAVLPVALRYDPVRVARWEKFVSMPRVVWRIVTYPGPLRADVLPLEVRRPQPDDDIPALAEATQRDLAAALGVRAGTVRHEVLRQQPEAWLIENNGVHERRAGRNGAEAPASDSVEAPASERGA